MDRRYVLDASALLTLLLREPGFHRVEQLIHEAQLSANPLLLSVVNWGEILYLSWQRHGEHVARATMADLARFPIRTLPVDIMQAERASELKVTHQIPYVDCIAAALASLNHATLVTSDRDFEKLGRHFPILWLHRP